MRLNLVFHNIVKDKKDIKSDFCITQDYYFELIEKLENLIKEDKTKFKELGIYFDDGYSSFKKIIFPKIKNHYQQYYLAIVTDWINKVGHLNEKDLISLNKLGVNICSHGVSHSALSIYLNENIQPTPNGGEYKNTLKGKKKVLNENEVIYQLKKSKEKLEKILDNQIDEFVLPYGLYNNQTIKINKNNDLYKNVSTCDEALDKENNIKPRFLVMNTRTIEDTLKLILKLK